jgi:hypothetical protein
MHAYAYTRVDEHPTSSSFFDIQCMQHEYEKVRKEGKKNRK